MGAWIEISALGGKTVVVCVAPLVGAWIEITLSRRESNFVIVAPLVGAWIEIILASFSGFASLSLLSWERGLKSLSILNFIRAKKSLLSWERGLKLYMH